MILVAGGGHGRVVLNAALECNFHVQGFVDIQTDTDEIFGVPYLGSDDYLDSLDVSSISLLNGFGFVKGKNLRKDHYLRLKAVGFTIHGICHPSVIQGRDCLISPEAQIMAGVVLQTNVTIGANTVINTSVTIDHDVQIGDHCFISPGVTVCGGVSIGNEVFVGAGAILVPGVRLESKSFVKAGSLVQPNK